MFLCNGGKGYKGEFIYIRDDREEGVGVEYFSLCEVRVFGLQGDDPIPKGMFLRIESVKSIIKSKSKDALRNTAGAALEFIETSSVVTFKCSTTNRIKIYPFNIHFLYFVPCFNLTAMVVRREADWICEDFPVSQRFPIHWMLSQNKTNHFLVRAAKHTSRNISWKIKLDVRRGNL